MAIYNHVILIVSAVAVAVPMAIVKIGGNAMDGLLQVWSSEYLALLPSSYGLSNIANAIFSIMPSTATPRTPKWFITKPRASSYDRSLLQIIR